MIKITISGKNWTFSPGAYRGAKNRTVAFDFITVNVRYYFGSLEVQKGTRTPEQAAAHQAWVATLDDCGDD